MAGVLAKPSPGNVEVIGSIGGSGIHDIGQTYHLPPIQSGQPFSMVSPDPSLSLSLSLSITIFNASLSISAEREGRADVSRAKLKTKLPSFLPISLQLSV